MAKTQYWEDTTHYALQDLGNGPVAIDLRSGGMVIIDLPARETQIAIAELQKAGCPTVSSREQLNELRHQARGIPKYELLGGPDLKLWHDKWGNILLRAAGYGEEEPVHLSKYEALALGQRLIDLASTKDPSEG